jgi:hypothetical protein
VASSSSASYVPRIASKTCNIKQFNRIVVG